MEWMLIIGLVLVWLRQNMVYQELRRDRDTAERERHAHAAEHACAVKHRRSAPRVSSSSTAP